jgi:GT2 family glycosyltransferase
MPVADRTLVTVGIVTYNSVRDIGACLDALARQSWPCLEVVTVDNASRDGTLEALDSARVPLRRIANADNRGFAAGHNQAVAASEGEYYLALNPDVVLRPEFIERLLDAVAVDPRVGSAGGKLLRPETDSAGRPRLDSTGLHMTPAVRHFDRGSTAPDRGQFEVPQYVFGITGAALLARRRMLEDVAVGGEFFDESFFCYREDADLAWRAQLLGWRALYVPTAVAVHRRRLRPEAGRGVDPGADRHSVKNRFLLRLKNQTPLDFVVLFLPSLCRDMLVVGGVLLRERASLSGLWWVWRHLPDVWRKRRAIMRRRRASSWSMLAWFRWRPVAFPVPPR